MGTECAACDTNEDYNVISGHRHAHPRTPIASHRTSYITLKHALLADNLLALEA